MASKNWTLNTDSMQEDFFADAALIGIVSQLPDYQFCWLLNQHFDMDFKRDPEQDICMHTGKAEKEEHYFPVYQYASPLNGPKYVLYRLRSQSQQLLPETKGLDYLWMVQGACPDTHAELLAGHLRSMPQVQFANMVSQEKLKHRNYLII